MVYITRGFKLFVALMELLYTPAEHSPALLFKPMQTETPIDPVLGLQTFGIFFQNKSQP